MKKFFLATAATFAIFAGAAFAGPTENITGCATKPVEGGNYTNFVDPNCYKAKDSTGIDPVFLDFVAGNLAEGEEASE